MLTKGTTDELERRAIGNLTEDEIERIAKRAAEIVEANFTLQVGKVTIRIVLYVVGAATLALLGWLGLAGKVKL